MSNQKSVIITGGSRGIGAAIANYFADHNYNIAIIDLAESSEEQINQLEARGAQVLNLKGDISDYAFAEEAVKEVKAKFGQIDVLINNAGITRDTLLIRMKESEFDDVIKVNLKGTFNMVKHAAKIMLKQKSGAIVNISSIVAETGNTGQLNYAASKAGVIGLTKTAARELGARGITVNAIAPGYIATDMTEALPDKIKDEMKASIPLERFGTVDEVAHAAFFLSENRYITGATLDINGGMAMN